MPQLSELSRRQLSLVTSEVLQHPSYSNKLARVGRWLTGDKPAFTEIDNEFSESVMQHVQFGINRIFSTQNIWPRFSRYSNSALTSLIFSLHDAGELGEGGDIPQTDPSLLDLSQSAKDLADEQKRSDEICIFRTKVHSNFRPEVQQPLYEAFDTYMWRNNYCMPGDSMVPYHMAKWWDVTVGNEIALHYFYPNPYVFGEHRNSKIIPNRIYRTTKNFLQQTQRVCRALNSRRPLPQDVDSEWRKIVAVGAHPLMMHGYFWLAKHLVQKSDQYIGIKDLILGLPKSSEVEDYLFDTGTF